MNKAEIIDAAGNRLLMRTGVLSVLADLTQLDELLLARMLVDQAYCHEISGDFAAVYQHITQWIERLWEGDRSILIGRVLKVDTNAWVVHWEFTDGCPTASLIDFDRDGSPYGDAPSELIEAVAECRMRDVLLSDRDEREAAAARYL